MKADYVASNITFFLNALKLFVSVNKNQLPRS